MTMRSWVRRTQASSEAGGTGARQNAVRLGLLAGGLVYVLLTTYALRSQRHSDAELARLDADRQAMTALAEEAQRLRPEAEKGARAAEAGIDALLGTLPPGIVLAGTGRNVTATLKDVRADGLARWLFQLRTAYRIDVTEAHLSAPAPGAWSGTLRLQAAEGGNGR